MRHGAIDSTLRSPTAPPSCPQGCTLGRPASETTGHPLGLYGLARFPLLCRSGNGYGRSAHASHWHLGTVALGTANGRVRRGTTGLGLWSTADTTVAWSHSRFSLLPSASQSWDRSHCTVPKVHGIQYVQPKVHHCWHFGGLLCLRSDPSSSPCMIPCTLANPKGLDGAPAGRCPMRTRAFMDLPCMCICPGRQDTPGYTRDKTRGSRHSACLHGEWQLHFAAQVCHTLEK